MSADFVPGASRRMFLETMAGMSGLGLAAMMAGCRGEKAAVEGAGGKPLKALFSNAGLQSTWCKLGKDTAELWGRLLNVEIEWIDGEFSAEKQRQKFDAAVGKEWDFCCVQAQQIDSLADPIQRLKKRNVPVLSMDTLLVARERLREVGVWTLVTPDQVGMGESSTKYLCEAIGGKGKVIHIGGDSGHSGAQGRMRGFDNVIEKYPGIQVVGDGKVRWCDWKPEDARNAFEALLGQESEPIAGAFFHSDDMALGSVPALANTVHKNMVVTAVDGQKEGLAAIREGRLAATTVNPVCLIHMTSLVVGQFVVRNNESVEDVPLEIVTPGPLVTRETGNLEAMLYLADPKHCLV